MLAQRSILLASIPLLALLAGSPTASSESPRPLLAFLSGLKEVPSVSTEGRGSLRIRVVGDVAFYELSYEGLEGSSVLSAHIHFGRPGTNGGVMVFLCSNTPSPVLVRVCPAPEGGTVSGIISDGTVIGPADQGISPGEFEEFLRALRSRAAYVNVHTDAFPAGEIRGNVF
jgi:hypothetical protein